MNPLAIRIAANLAEFKANMAEMRTQLETNASAMKRMSNSFDGSKVIGDANAMVKAIHDIGGASKLTESEQKRVNAAVTEAIAKYQSLGRQAPPELIALRDATVKVNTETAKMPSMMDRIKGSGVAMGAALGTFVGGMAWSAVNKLGAEVGEFMKKGSQLPALQSSFQSLAKGINVSSDQMLAGMQRASRGMVSEFDLMKSANKAMLLGLPVTEQSMGTLTKAAVTLGRAMGLDARQSVDDLITALGRSSPMILDNLGLTVKVGEANEVYARQLGKTVEQLTDAEKKTAFYNEAMRKAEQKTKELGEQTLTLGDYLGIVWTKFGDQVTEETARANEGIGRFIGAWGAMKKMIAEGPTGGMGAALAPIIPTSPQAAMIQGLIPVIKKTNDLTEEQTKIYARQSAELSKSIAAQDAYNSKIQALADKFTGRNLNKEIADLAAGVARAGGAAKISEFEYAALGKTLSDKFRQGARFANEELHKMWLSHERLNPSIKVTTDAYKILADLSKTIKPVQLGMPTPTDTMSVSDDPYGIIKQIERSLILAGKDTRIKLAAAPVAESIGRTMVESLTKALSGLGAVIVGAIQGGGDVGRAAFASIGSTLGNDLGAEITKGLTKSLGKSLAGLIGGLAGPLGGLLGSAVGGLVDKIFGKNQGREDAKSFAKDFGGFDALREKMLSLGAEGDKLWIALTQNTKGPAQVAATIKAIEEAFLKAEAAAAKTGETLKDTFTGPEGARGFPTREQLNKAAADAEETWRYIKDSGLYNAAQVEQAWEQWQDALVAAGDTSILKVRELDKEIKSLQEAIAMEPPEFDAEGNREYGVEEWNNIQKLQAAEAERARLTQEHIKAEMDARQDAANMATGLVANQITIEESLRTDALKDISAMTGVEMAEQVKSGEMAAKAASAAANKEFETAKVRAKDLDAYLTKLFTGGYEIPITFKFPNGAPGGQPATPPSWFGGSSTGATPAPSGGGQAAFTIVNVTELDGEVVAKKTVKHTAKLLPGELSFTGAWQ